MKTVKSPKGNDLPLTNLKGKDYLMVAYRIQWLNEDPSVASFKIDTDFLLLNEDQTIARAQITLYDKDGKFLRSATSTKRETKKDFPDHTEKAETSAVGRCLAMLGYGTQFAVADLDEGDRLADSPLAKPSPVAVVADAPVARKSSFRKPAVVLGTGLKDIPAETVAAVEATDTHIPASSVPVIVPPTSSGGWE